MLGHGFRNRQLQLCSHMVGDRWNSYVGGSVYTVCNWNRDHYGDIKPRYDQVRFGDSGGDRPAHDHVGERLLQSQQYTNQPNHPVLGRGFRHRQLQLRSHLVGDRWNSYVGGCVYAVCNWNCHHHGDIKPRHDQIWLCNGNGDNRADGHFGWRFLQSNQRSDRSHKPVFGHCVGNRQLQLRGDMVGGFGNNL